MRARGNLLSAYLLMLSFNAILGGIIAFFFIGKNVTTAFVIIFLLIAGMGGFLVALPLTNRLFGPFFPPLFLSRMASRPPPKKAFNPDANLGDFVFIMLIGILASVGIPYLIHLLGR